MAWRFVTPLDIGTTMGAFPFNCNQAVAQMAQLPYVGKCML
jgi:hypothetical protein